MSDGITADVSEVDELVRDLREVAGLIPGKVRQAIQQTGIRGKDVWQKDAKSKAGRRTRGYPGSIDYDIKGSVMGGGTVEGEIGPNLSRGGKTGKGGLVPSLGILEESVGSRGSILVAYKFVEEELDRGIQIAIDQSMKARGL